jgi:hypothetical protein
VIQVSQPSPTAAAAGPAVPRTRAALIGLAVLVLAVGATLALGVAALLGERVRAAALIADRSAAPSAALRYTDAPQSAAFFEGRDSATVRVPWEMTVAEFLSLYHLENNASARASLERELGAVELDDVLREGDEITIRLTATRGAGG